MNQTQTILYVEDNLDNFKLVNRILTIEGFSVYNAVDSREAYTFLSQHTPDLILMDINLPEVDGYTLAGQLRQQPELAEIPIVALTANVMKQDREKSLAAGCNGFIKKPIDVDELPEQIRYYLNMTTKVS
jgi:two-component system cell cycle response regulator DivK